MSTYLSGNVMGNMYSSPTQMQMPTYPMSQGSANFTTPWGVGQNMIQGSGTSQIGPMGVSTSVPWAPGFSATPANTVNGLGLASPFATTMQYLQNNTFTSFGQENPYSPVIGTPYDLNPDLLMVTGAFGGNQNSWSPYAGMAGAPLSDGSFGYGGPGGSQGGTFLDSLNYGSAGLGGGGTAYPPQMGGGYGGGMAYPPQMGGGGAYPQQMGGGYSPMGAVPNQFANPNLFASAPLTGMSGVAQSVGTMNGSFASRYNVISDGISRLFMQGQADPYMPRTAYGGGTKLNSPIGGFETSVGWAGGNANAGIYGAQASGMAWAKVTAPGNPGMTIGYANPYYNNYNFNTGFSTG